jgi:hypothetical protein
VRPLLPRGLLDEFRQHTWISPVSPETAVDRLLDWLEEHPADATRLLPHLEQEIRTRLADELHAMPITFTADPQEMASRDAVRRDCERRVRGYERDPLARG